MNMNKTTGATLSIVAISAVVIGVALITNDTSALWGFLALFGVYHIF